MFDSLGLSKAILVDGEYVKPYTTRLNLLAVAIAGLGGFNFGYATNAMAGSFAQPSFIEKFLSGENATSIITSLTGVFLGCGLIGSILQAPISHRWGRRYATGTSALILTISGALQAGSVHTAMLIVSRALCGIGAGMALTSCPVYMSEISPAHTRGMLTGSQGITVTFAYLVSSCLALAWSYVRGPYSWRLQFVMSTVTGLLFLVALLFVPESPRWLVENERYDEAWKILQQLHQSKSDHDGHLVRAEMRQIRAQIDSERSQPSSYWFIMTNAHLRKRAICSILAWLLSQSSGVMVIASFTPTLFGKLGYSNTVQFGLSIAWTATSLIAGICNAYLVERVGRIKLFVIGGCLCSSTLIVEAVLQKYYLNANNHDGIRAAVAMYFIFVIGYAGSVECSTYAYTIEIWPTHLRAQGGTIALSTFFVVSCSYATAASTAFDSIGWKYYLIMACVCIASAITISFYCPETKGLTLEEVGAKFGDHVQLMMNEGDVTTASEKIPSEERMETATS